MDKNNLPATHKREVIQSFLITSARYKFSVYEKRILSKIITSMQPMIEGKHLHGRVERTLFGDIKVEYPLTFITDDDTNRVQYQEALKALATKGIEFENEKVWQFCNIIQSPKIIKNKGIVNFTICTEMVDLFLNFSKGYSKYILEISLKLRSVASCRLYELISNQPTTLKYKIDNLKKLLGAENYLNGNFIQRILIPAQKELNEVANWSFDYKLIRKGRRYEYILLYPINYKEREPQEVQEQDLQRRTNLSWYAQKDVRDFLTKTCNFSQRELKNNKDTLSKFCTIFANDAKGKLMEIWSRSQDKINPKAYIIKVMKLEIED